MVYQIKQQCLWGGANFDRENVKYVLLSFPSLARSFIRAEVY